MAFSSSSSDTNFGDSSYRDSRSANASRTPRAEQSRSARQRPGSGGLQFDIISWYPKYKSCQRYFLDHAQHEELVQAFTSFINIQLPFQRTNPIYNSAGATTFAERHTRPSSADSHMTSVSLLPYIRRLVATGMDVPQILHGFFGDDWAAGIGPQRESERRNYLFATKSGEWSSVKREYDMSPLETIPFLRPLQNPGEEELDAAERAWSEWLAVSDLMVGGRAPR